MLYESVYRFILSIGKFYLPVARLVNHISNLQDVITVTQILSLKHTSQLFNKLGKYAHISVGMAPITQ